MTPSLSDLPAGLPINIAGFAPKSWQRLMTARLCATHPQTGEKLVFRSGVKHFKRATLDLDRKELAGFQAVVERHLGTHLRSLTIQAFKTIETTEIHEASNSSDAEGKLWHTRNGSRPLQPFSHTLQLQQGL